MAVTLALASASADFDLDSALAGIGAEADWVGLRFVEEFTQRRSVRNGKPEANAIRIERGAMVEALVNGQIAYAATADTSAAGLRAAVKRAAQLAKLTAPSKAAELSVEQRVQSSGHYRTHRKLGFDQVSLAETTDRLIQACAHLRVDDRIVSSVAELQLVELQTAYASSNGTRVRQNLLMVSQGFSATVQDGGETQHRSLNGHSARSSQSGLDVLDWERLYAECERVGSQAIELLGAEECPSGRFDVVLAPDQMMLQIHESIGHPLELDRILGDERNYAGWSFIRPEDFGHLRYGSGLLNVTFDPFHPGEFAGYAFDDGGAPADRQYLIRDGILQRGLGGLESQARSGIPGVANFRATSWNRAPIDRMANINVEPGQSSFEELIGAINRGVYMEANRSWSIDDYRNKFQFGCEYAREIVDGRLGRVLKNPGYRGVTVPFWNNLKGVGCAADMRAFGTPNCGKGEPNQVIRVGHASPPCWFADVDVFGGGL